MDTSFDLVALLKQQPTTKNSHKIRPTQFVSVAGGVQKRLETNIKHRKSSRFSAFDKIRDITKCESPKAPNLSDAQQKGLHRKQQLEKWKEEKDRKKKEVAAQKKKPFVAAVSHRKTFGPPPPPPKPMPSTSGRVTRSQARQKTESMPSNAQTKSFAPSNAAFKPLIFLNTAVPTLAPINKKKASKPKPNITFEPVLPKNLQKETKTTRTTRAKPLANKPIVDNKKKRNEKTKAKMPVKPPLLKQQMFQSSSSSSDTDQPSKQRSKPSLQKSITKTQEYSVPMVQVVRASACLYKSREAEACALQETASMSSQDSQVSSQDPQDALKSQEQMFQSSSSSSDMDQPSKQRSKPSLQNSIIKTRVYPVSMIQVVRDSTSLEESWEAEACVLQETASMSSQDSQVSSQDPQDALKSQDSQDASMSQDTASMSSQDELSTPRNKVPKSESSSEEKLRSPKAVDIQLTPEQIAEEVKNISPCVTMSRGKDNARKEMKKKLEEGLLDEDNSNTENLNHFRQQLNSEIARITAKCEIWDQIFAQTVLAEPIQELVLSAVGQARLLMSSKFQQFAELVENCEHPTPGAPPVTPADLRGFWDMVFIQVENVDVRFKYLEELRLRDWIEEQKPAAKRVVAKPAAKKAAAKPSAGPSRLREMIAEARKAKKVQESQSEDSKLEKSEPTASPETKTFDAGFFRISSPMKRGSSVPGTPSNKVNLLKTVLSSEAKKSVCKDCTSFAMLRASLMSKNVNIEGVSPLETTPTTTPVNLYATPARSILKQNPVSNKKTNKLKTVLFHDEPSSSTSNTSCDKTEAEGPGIAPLPADDKENTATPKRASSRKSRLSRQNAEEQPSPVTTRSRCGVQSPLAESDNVEKKRTTRKSAQTLLVESDTVEKKRPTRRSAQTPLVESDNVEKKRITRRSAQTPLIKSDTNMDKKRSTRKKEVQAQETETPKRSTRKRKTAVADTD